MTRVDSSIDPHDDRLLRLWANCIKQAIKDYRAPPSQAKVAQEHRRTAEAFLRRLGYLHEDGSIGPPLDT